MRWNNVVGTEEYVARVASGRPPDLGRRRLSAGEQLEETLFMGLRLAGGVDLGRCIGEDSGLTSAESTDTVSHRTSMPGCWWPRAGACG